MNVHCPHCSKPTGQILCRINAIPVVANQLCRDKETAAAVPRGNIGLAYCDSCGLAWNCEYCPEKVSYDAKYDNSQDLGLEYQAHFNHMIDFLDFHIELKGKKVLEIGCGKGWFLTALAKNTGCVACGVDPSYLGLEQSEDGSCMFLKQYYDDALAKSLGEGNFDCIILRHVFEQLPNPEETMKNISFNLCKGGYLYIEGLDFQRLLNQKSILDLSYERYMYFTEKSLRHIMAEAGVEFVAQATSFHEQYMAVLGQKYANSASFVATAHRDIEVACPWMTEQSLDRGQSKLRELREKGKVALWGAANRGVMFCNLLDAEGKQIECVVDILPRKQGGFLPGSGHPIVAPEEVKYRGIKWVIASNKNYKLEIENQLQDMGSDAVVLTAEEILETNQ